MALNFVDLESSNLNATAYDADNKELHIKFKDGAHAIYSGVPDHIDKGLRYAKSAGGFFHKNIKNGGFRFRYAPAEEAPAVDDSPALPAQSGVYREGLL